MQPMSPPWCSKEYFMHPIRSSLLVLGLAAPMASNAASLNLAEVSQYASQE